VTIYIDRVEDKRDGIGLGTSPRSAEASIVAVARPDPSDTYGASTPHAR
jgi:hypothetical protein